MRTWQVFRLSVNWIGHDVPIEIVLFPYGVKTKWSIVSILGIHLLLMQFCL